MRIMRKLESKSEKMSENALSSRQRKSLSILSIRQGSTGLVVRVFPLERGNIDGIFDVLTKGIKTYFV